MAIAYPGQNVWTNPSLEVRSMEDLSFKDPTWDEFFKEKNMFDHIRLGFSDENKTRLSSNKVEKWLNIYSPDFCHKNSWWVDHPSRELADRRQSNRRLAFDHISLSFVEEKNNAVIDYDEEYRRIMLKDLVDKYPKYRGKFK